jgi:hypothetical protein
MRGDKKREKGERGGGGERKERQKPEFFRFSFFSSFCSSFFSLEFPFTVVFVDDFDFRNRFLPSRPFPLKC